MTIIRNLPVSRTHSTPGAKRGRFYLLSALLLLCRTVNAAEGEHFYRSFDGTNIHYQVRGSGPAVLLIHGFTVTGDSWKDGKVYGALLANGFKVILVDLRGNGLSDKPQRLEDYANDAEARDLKILIGNLKLKSYSAVGYSRGAIIAAKLLVLDPRVSKAVLGGMGLAFTDPNWQLPRQAYRALMGGSEPQLDWLIKRVKDAGLDPKIQAYIQLGQPSASAAELSAVKRPVLVICGAQDDSCNKHDASAGSAQELASLIPGARTVVLPGDHKDVWLSQDLASNIIAFLGPVRKTLATAKSGAGF
jgi:pimeloyl-ACP methyl ester carboxylesterase